VASFRATLEEIGDADLLLHVVDITHPNASEQAQAVLTTLDEIGVADVPMVTALNKIDAFANPQSIVNRVDEFERAVPISALTGEGIPSLLTTTEYELIETTAVIKVHLPYKEGRLISLFHEEGIINDISHGKDAVIIGGHVPNRLINQFQAYIVPPVETV
jgi:GTP-binding protein HflX